jgi:hypothetical protein
MSRFITVNVGCDWAECDVIAPEGEGTVVEKTVALDGKQARAFLVCKQHLEDLDEILLPLLQAGIKVEEPAKKKRSTAASSGNGSGTSPSSAAAGPGELRDPDQTIDCLITGCKRTGANGLHNRTGMAQHVIRTHQYPSLAAYEAEFGIVD